MGELYNKRREKEEHLGQKNQVSVRAGVAYFVLDLGWPNWSHHHTYASYSSWNVYEHYTLG